MADDVVDASAQAHVGAYGPPAHQDSHVLVYSLFVNLFVLILGFVLWPLFDHLGFTCAKDGHGSKKRITERLFGVSKAPLTIVAQHYTNFLAECRSMFVCLTILSAVATVPLWGFGPTTFGLLGDTLNTAGTLESTGVVVLCMDTLVRGCVALGFVERLRRGTKKPTRRDKDRDVISRTLWLSGLPSIDTATNSRFQFDGKDFEAVQADLEKALNDELNKKTIGTIREHGMRVHVAPIVDEWHKVSQDLRMAQEQREAYAYLVNQLRIGFVQRMLSDHYQKKYERYKADVARLSQEVSYIESAKKGLSGAAFVTFEMLNNRNHFLKEKPRWYSLRSYAYFTFGRPPFASVTLACTRAPHPTDVEWKNLHITPTMQKMRGGVLILVLFVAMITLVTPVTISSQLNILIPAFRHRIQVIAEAMHAESFISRRGDTPESWRAAATQVPGVLLVIINSLILPDLIYRIAVNMRLHRKSSMEVIQLHLNYAFLVLNSLVVPTLQLSSIGALVEWGERQVSGSSQLDLLSNMMDSVMQSSGVFAVRYILNCACMSNTNSLLQIGQLLYRYYARNTARTARDFVEAEETWIFAWGYWYAWTLSVFTMGIFLSTVVPSVLPASAVFFAVQHFVDRHNLARGVFGNGSEAENVMITRALHYMRCIIAAWWIMMACIFWFILHRGNLPKWDSRVPEAVIRGMIVALLVFSSCLVAWSWWDQQSILHDSNFEEIDVSKRGMHRHGLCAFLDPYLDQANKWMGINGQYSSVEIGPGEATDAEGFLDDVGRRGAIDLDNLGVAHVHVGSSTARARSLAAGGGANAKNAYATGGPGIQWDARSIIVGETNHPL